MIFIIYNYAVHFSEYYKEFIDRHKRINASMEIAIISQD
jgi:hypothetical protein